MKTFPNINKKKLWKLAKAGKSAREIMKTMGIKDRADLRNTLHHVMLESGELFSVPGLG